mmetsp:Transcript_33776/g.100322  ORF Transcript_33776/g.100322 Transcript_33776/m.100322 type:complete len:218 (-) Transcript_33776:294-947(-)
MLGILIPSCQGKPCAGQSAAGNATQQWRCPAPGSTSSQPSTGWPPLPPRLLGALAERLRLHPGNLRLQEGAQRAPHLVDNLGHPGRPRHLVAQGLNVWAQGVLGLLEEALRDAAAVDGAEQAILTSLCGLHVEDAFGAHLVDDQKRPIQQRLDLGHDLLDAGGVAGPVLQPHAVAEHPLDGLLVAVPGLDACVEGLADWGLPMLQRQGGPQVVRVAL